MSSLLEHLVPRYGIIYEAILKILKKQQSCTAEGVSIHLANEGETVDVEEAWTVLHSLQEKKILKQIADNDNMYAIEWGFDLKIKQPTPRDTKTVMWKNPVHRRITNLEGVFLINDVLDMKTLVEEIEMDDDIVWSNEEGLKIKDIIPENIPTVDEEGRGRRWNVHIVVEMWEPEGDQSEFDVSLSDFLKPPREEPVICVSCFSEYDDSTLDGSCPDCGGILVAEDNIRSAVEYY
jgi:hypothetical protein